ncbi:UDP-3-O-(3-hydroxymyristoyl)glucosamine N-acyltransferase [uncultured Propionivibrio sp.]|uniref:UDP-3-O-(3-hydroxymyristoyl)glucosamine N-acyltransferase n=1 Tax=uncultured Propionivibrio sp. TaxID=426737 RepID=UPI0029BFFD1C|nr:UDP-3-O-(3-hydroxymyristoyl)glucosamine N-acyltransferase [uncultured Propionivibrio sp.]
MRLDAIVAELGGELRGDGSVEVVQVASLTSAGPGYISFFSNSKLKAQLKETRASAVILAPGSADDTELPRIVHQNPYAYYARVVALLNPAKHPRAGIHAKAVVASSLPDSVTVGACAVVGERVRCGENVVLYPGCVIGDDVSIGDDTVIYANAVVYQGCVIGKRAVIQSGAVIGSDGFGFAREGERWIKIPQIGRVVIGDDVEIGANTSVDRGALDDTVIGNGVKLDNQIQIAHNVQIGDHSAMAGCVGVAGSTRFGKRCTVGGAGMVSGHLEIADDVHISAGTLVGKSLKQAGVYTSVFPLDTHDGWLQNAAQIRRLSKLAERVSELEKALKEKSITP